jgi:hypothetical protein
MLDLEIDDLEKELKMFAKRAYPFATKQTLNKTAAVTREFAQEEIDRKFIQRNTWTRRTVRFNMTTTLDVDRQESEVGSIEDYMETQEKGGFERKKGRHGVAIPTAYSAGQGHARQRTRLVRRPNQLRVIKFQQKRFKSLGRTPKQRLKVAVKTAIKRGDRFLYAEFSGRRKGIMRLLGGKRRTRLEMVHDLTREIIMIPARPWLRPAVNRAVREMPGIYRAALIFQLKRHRII